MNEVRARGYAIDVYHHVEMPPVVAADGIAVQIGRRGSAIVSTETFPPIHQLGLGSKLLAHELFEGGVVQVGPSYLEHLYVGALTPIIDSTTQL
jgi:hypothetical protein